MNCYRCEADDLMLAALWPQDRVTYAKLGIVMRQCMNCGLEQNHCGDDEPMTPADAAQEAPPILRHTF